VSHTKYLVLVGDGMGDYPCKEVGGKTPLQAARTPHMDAIAVEGKMGMVRTIPPDMEAGSDIANLNIMGYDPSVFHTGRAPLEAASMGIELREWDVAFRCNLVTLAFQKHEKIVMEDYAGGHIRSEVGRLIIERIEDHMGCGRIHFFPGVSYRHLMVSEEGKLDFPSIPPHDMLGQDVGVYLNDGQLGHLNRIIRKSWTVFEELRQENSKITANSIWLWGQGKAPQLPAFQRKYGVSGGVISAVDLLKGIGVYAGLKPISVPGATGFLDTNYEGKVQHALSALDEMDFIYLHVEAPDEAAHSGDVKLKMRAIEDFDQKVVGPVMEGLKRFSHVRLLLITDHFTPISVRTHTADPVPFVIYDSKDPASSGPAGRAGFNETDAQATGLFVEDAHTLMHMLVRA